MTEIKMDNVWRVTMTEYDWGAQRYMGTKYFDNEKEAKEFCKNYAGGSPECYYRASYEKV